MIITANAELNKNTNAIHHEDESLEEMVDIQ